MIVWLDAQLPPSVAAWITATFGIEAHAVRDLGLRDANAPSIFQGHCRRPRQLSLGVRRL